MVGPSDIFRQIADSLPQMVWSLAPDGRIEWVNRSFIDYTGSDASDENATDDAHLVAFVHPEDHARLADEWRAAFRKGETYRYEFRLMSRTGAYRWFLAQATPYRNARGDIERWYGISTEIDAIKAADASIRAVLEAIPESMSVASADGNVTHVNARFCAYTGKRPDELTGFGWLDVVHPDDLPLLIEARDRGVANGSVTEWTHRMRRHDGTYREHLSRAAPLRDENGVIVRWSAIATDIHDQIREREELRLLADTIPQFICVSSADGRLAYANAQFWAYTGLTPSPDAFVWDRVVHPGDIEAARAFWARRSDRDDPPELELRMRRSDGVYRWFQSRLSTSRDGVEADRFFTTATDIHDRKRTADMMAFLAEASDVLNAPRDVEVALELAAGLAVPRIADWCAVYLREPNGFFRPAAIHHADPGRVELAHELVRRYPFSVESSRELIETRAPQFLPAISAEMIDAGAVDQRHASLLRQLDLASAIVVPLIVDDEVTGMLHLVRGRDNEPFVRADVDFAQIVAKRIAVAIDNAVMYERARNVATTFQNAALPQTLPVIDGLALHRAYRAGDHGVTVGGDWYDAVRLRDGSLLFSIGDVAGKGLDAAVLMASMRQAIRVAGLQGLAPGAVLEAANASLAAEHAGRFVTAFVGRLDLASGRLEYASAGHPAPLVRDDDGLRALAFGDPPLGVWEGAFATHTIHVRAPWLIVAYTDGLIERTGDVVEGDALLRAVASDEGIMHTADPASYLQARLLRGAVRDDTAILTLRADGVERWRFGANDALRAEPTRLRLKAWLAQRAHGDCAAAELIYGELIGNVVRHAPGAIDVDVVCSADRIRLFVQSEGQPFDLHPRLPDSLLSESGRGLFIVDTLGSGLSSTGLPIFGNQISVDLPLVPSVEPVAT